MATCTKRRRLIGAALTIALPALACGYFGVAPGEAGADTGTPDDVKATLTAALVQARDSEAFVDYTNRTPYFKADATTDEVIASIKAQMERNEEMMALVAE